MALLKSLIQRLLDSRTTPEEAGHSAMPSPTEVSLTPSVTSQEVWGDVCTGIASSDGYIRMDFGATSPEAIGSARSFGAVAFSTPQKTGDIVSVICPVAKGMAYAMSVRNANNITCAFVKLIGSIGGGQALKNALLQGGVLCRLSRLYSSLRRSSCRVRDRGFNTQLVRPWMQRPSALQPTVIGTRLHPAGTVMSHTLETPQALFWKSLVVAQVSLILNRLQDGILFRYRKVKNLVISFQQIQQFRICTLSLCEEKTNFAVGGASC